MWLTGLDELENCFGFANLMNLIYFLIYAIDVQLFFVEVEVFSVVFKYGYMSLIYEYSIRDCSAFTFFPR